MTSSPEPTESTPSQPEVVADDAGCAEPGCREAVEELYVYLDGHIDDARKDEIQHHLEACAPCLDTFDFHAELKKMVSQRCQSELPEGMKDRVLAALRTFGELDDENRRSTDSSS